MTAKIPTDLVELLERPLFGGLGTIRPDGTVQINPMWYEFDGDQIRFSHTSTRGKFRNLQRNPAMTLLIIDPDDPDRVISRFAGNWWRSCPIRRGHTTCISASAMATRMSSRRLTAVTA